MRYLLRALTAVCLFTCFEISHAQNLVLNPSFELYSSCPQGISEFYLATDWSTTCTPSSDSCSTPDLYEACSPFIGGANVPNAFLGYHTARTGTGFAGFISGVGISGCIPTYDNYREYVEGTLSAPLVAGQHYLVLFYLNLAEPSMWGSNSIGVYFTNTQYIRDACPNSLIAATPQLEMCGPAVMDTVNWIPVEWIYAAVGGEQYFTIGNFKNDSSTNRVPHNCGTREPYIYYYIDDVSISPVPEDSCAMAVLTDSLSADCGATDGSASVTALGCSGPFSYHWSNGSTDSVTQNIGSGIYTVTVTGANNCSVTALVSVNAKAITLSDSASYPVCGNNYGTVAVTPLNGAGPFTYLWSNGATAQVLTNVTAGTYYVTVTGVHGCVSYDSVSITAPYSINVTITVDSPTCNNSNGIATAHVSGSTVTLNYLWSNGQTSQTITGLAPGNYTVTVTGNPAGTPFWTEDFSSGGTGWTLNTQGTGSNGNSANQWIINSVNNCICGSGDYLHISPSANTECYECIILADLCTYLELDSSFGEGDFSTDVLAISPVISTIGQDNLTLSFNWESLGTPGSDYGLVDLSKDGGATWTSLPFRYGDSANCSLASVSVPWDYQEISTFRIAFEWINGAGNDGNSGNPPGFVIDNIALSPGVCPATATVSLSSTSTLTINTSSTPAGCTTGGTATVSVVTGQGPYVYLWSNTANTDTLSNLSAGNYTVTVTDVASCTVSSGVAISTSNGAIALADTSSPEICGESNGSAMVSATGGQGQYSFVWSNQGSHNSISNVASGMYDVTVTDTAGCSASTLVNVGLLPLPSVNITQNKYMMCVGDTVTFGAPAGYSSYAWSNGDTGVYMMTTQPGNYNVTVTAHGNCTAVSDTDIVALFAFTVISVSTSGDTLTAELETNYQWYLDSVAIAGATSATYIAPQTGTYFVTATDGNGCAAASQAQSITVTGLAALHTDETIKIYPNPLQSGNWHLEVGNEWLGATCKIYDATGRLI